MHSSAKLPAERIGWLAALHPQFLARPSVVLLVAVNLLPIVGVLFWAWDLFSLMVLYWAETGVIGAFAILHMAMVGGRRALIMVPFFVFHFGMFMSVHLVFITLLFGGQAGVFFGEAPSVVASVAGERGLWLAFLALVFSHGVSFVLNVLLPHLRDPRAPDGDPQALMTAPYRRVIVMHVTIILGAFLSLTLGTPLATFVLLVALKTAVDVAAHVREHFGPDDEPDQPASRPMSS